MTKPTEPHIVAAWPSPAAGPGWANTPLCYLIQHSSGAIEIRWLQPDEMDNEVLTLYKVADAAHSAFVSAVRRLVEKKGKGKE